MIRLARKWNLQHFVKATQQSTQLSGPVWLAPSDTVLSVSHQGQSGWRLKFSHVEQGMGSWLSDWIVVHLPIKTTGDFRKSSNILKAKYTECIRSMD